MIQFNLIQCVTKKRRHCDETNSKKNARDFFNQLLIDFILCRSLSRYLSVYLVCAVLHKEKNKTRPAKTTMSTST